MKPTELMIGDWVLLFDKYPAKVEAIGDTDAFLLDTDGVRWNVGYAFIKPIPLKQETLEKNGFYREDFYSALDYNGEYRVLCDGHQVAIFHKAHTEIDIPIEGVHELQHALRLCGIEKEIVL